jgi:hypothetical protein
MLQPDIPTIGRKTGCMAILRSMLVWQVERRISTATDGGAGKAEFETPCLLPVIRNPLPPIIYGILSAERTSTGIALAGVASWHVPLQVACRLFGSDSQKSGDCRR